MVWSDVICVRASWFYDLAMIFDLSHLLISPSSPKHFETARVASSPANLLLLLCWYSWLSRSLSMLLAVSVSHEFRKVCSSRRCRWDTHSCEFTNNFWSLNLFDLCDLWALCRTCYWRATWNRRWCWTENMRRSYNFQLQCVQCCSFHKRIGAWK